MKYELELDINLPRKKVIELFDNVDNLKKWQPGLVSFDHISGTQGEVGAKSNLHFKMGKREFKMVETITAKNLPDEFSGTYELKGMWNHAQNFFVEKDEQTTSWKVKQEFKGKGLMALMCWLMPGAFKKQTHKYMGLFKAFAEKAAQLEKRMQ